MGDINEVDGNPLSHIESKRSWRLRELGRKLNRSIDCELKQTNHSAHWTVRENRDHLAVIHIAYAARRFQITFLPFRTMQFNSIFNVIIVQLPASLVPTTECCQIKIVYDKEKKVNCTNRERVSVDSLCRVVIIVKCRDKV